MRINLNNIAFLCSLIVVLAFSSCRSKKGIAVVPDSRKQDYSVLFSDKEQIHSLQSQLQINAKGMTVKGDLRIVKDRAIYLSVQAFLGLEVVRMRISPDSIVVLDRLNRRYFADSFLNIKAVSGKRFSFFMFQSLFLNQVFCPGKERLSDINRDDFLKVTTDNQLILSPKRDEYIQFCIDNQKQLVQTRALGESGKFSLMWSYSGFSSGTEVVFPSKMDIDLKSGKNSLVGSMLFTRLEWNKAVNTECVVPSRYTRVEFSEILKIISSM